ncbi:DsbA family protein [Corynebacterium gerontici]|uniref:Disulfide bond formation protein D n=1 Tax=Corynebacterium gerontici TaxID=2079234 RepID=A0A3G6J2E3_9CORY|nr:thioredoxin domain-containing protein [Corynebacterium gerontici]AZA12231.1 Disulfide bond formation protein D precursor [Corynebacterium gerontici]
MSSNKPNRPVLIALIVVVVLVVGAGAYFFGLRSGNTRGGEHTQQAASSKSSASADAQVRQKVTPGTKGLEGPKPLEDGSYNAMIVGPKAPIRSAEDVLNVHRRNPEDPFAIGAVDAPVVISEFSDFECPFCSRWANETEPALIRDYVDQGLVRIEWNDMPVNGPAAEAAAKAGRAAAAQGKFQEFKRAWYEETAQTQGHPNFQMEDYVRIAKKAGVPDLAQFQAQAGDGTFDEVIAQAQQYGASIGINGTPAFVVGEQFISGAQPLSTFVQTIDAELQKVADA